MRESDVRCKLDRVVTYEKRRVTSVQFEGETGLTNSAPLTAPVERILSAFALVPMQHKSATVRRHPPLCGAGAQLFLFCLGQMIGKWHMEECVRELAPLIDTYAELDSLLSDWRYFDPAQMGVIQLSPAPPFISPSGTSWRTIFTDFRKHCVDLGLYIPALLTRQAAWELGHSLLEGCVLGNQWSRLDILCKRQSTAKRVVVRFWDYIKVRVPSIARRVDTRAGLGHYAVPSALPVQPLLVNPQALFFVLQSRAYVLTSVRFVPVV